MMNIRQRIATALRGEQPDRVPFTAYEWMWGDEEKADVLIERGLGPTRHVETCRRQVPELQVEEEVWEENGHNWSRRIMHTPAGELERISMDGWTQEYFVKDPEDYEVVEWIARNTHLEENFAAFLREQEAMADRGIVVVSAHRTPIQEIMVELTGIENFCYHLADELEELARAHEAMLDRTLREIEIVARGPGEFVKLWENFTDEPFGPDRFRKFHLPVYQKVASVLHEEGKILAAHTDGWLSRVKEIIPDTGIDVLESLTPPSEGDVPPEEWNEIWPETVYWSNIPVSWYLEPVPIFADRLRVLLDRIGTQRGLLFEISEDLPRNWTESVPVVLEVLEEYSV
ncbi:MAG: hypothetical protein ACLFWL_16760 [Candidatus Brocadiia bacterium]